MFLAQWGGHIGYVVRPAFRRHGYATQMLRQSLPIARTVGLKRVLVTCDDTNIGSARVIERCGGILQNKLPGPDGQPPKRRYWIEMTGVAHHPE
jgi:predicted acetyltransferase